MPRLHFSLAGGVNCQSSCQHHSQRQNPASESCCHRLRLVAVASMTFVRRWVKVAASRAANPSLLMLREPFAGEALGFGDWPRSLMERLNHAYIEQNGARRSVRRIR